MEYLIYQSSQEMGNTCLTEETKAKLTKAGFTIRDVDWNEKGLYYEAYQTSFITLNSLEDLPALYKAVGMCIFSMNSIMICD